MSLPEFRRATAGFRLSRLTVALIGGLTLLAASPAAAEPALWKVRGPHATIYLFGTIHTLHADTAWHSQKLDAAFRSSGTLYEELPNIDDQSIYPPLIAKYGLDPTHSLSGKLGPAGQARLAAVAAVLGAPVAQLQPLRPWFAAVQLSTLKLVRAGYDPNAGVDLKLKALAAAQGKAVAGFETAEQGFRTLADLPEPLELQFLLSTLDEADQGSASLDRIVAAWSAGDVARLQVLIGGSLALKYPELYRRIFTDRNRAFATRIEALLKGEGVYFVAIGAGHLAGPDSVQADLARDGIIVSRM
jgi:uncharacterized protein YbaP (TraB family)